MESLLKHRILDVVQQQRDVKDSFILEQNKIMVDKVINAKTHKQVLKIGEQHLRKIKALTKKFSKDLEKKINKVTKDTQKQWNRFTKEEQKRASRKTKESWTSSANYRYKKQMEQFENNPKLMFEDDVFKRYRFYNTFYITLERFLIYSVKRFQDPRDQQKSGLRFEIHYGEKDFRKRRRD